MKIFEFWTWTAESNWNVQIWIETDVGRRTTRFTENRLTALRQIVGSSQHRTAIVTVTSSCCHGNRWRWHGRHYGRRRWRSNFRYDWIIESKIGRNWLRNRRLIHNVYATDAHIWKSGASRAHVRKWTDVGGRRQTATQHQIHFGKIRTSGPRAICVACVDEATTIWCSTEIATWAWRHIVT